jgi:hypothetical protein
MRFNTKALKRGAIIAALALPVLALAVWLLIGRYGPDRSAALLSQGPTTGFAFMDLGAQSTLSTALRRHLNDRLGDGALEKIGTLDLTFDHRRIYQGLLPDIADLDQALNRSPRERVEHPIVRLTYRYPEHRGTPFDLVQLIFARYDNRPLCFKITFTREKADPSEALFQKYGAPAADTVLDSGGRCTRWEKPGQVMVLLQSPDRLGRLTTHVMIYFIDTIKDLLARDHDEAGHGAIGDKDLF